MQAREVKLKRMRPNSSIHNFAIAIAICTATIQVQRASSKTPDFHHMTGKRISIVGTLFLAGKDGPYIIPDKSKNTTLTISWESIGGSPIPPEWKDGMKVKVVGKLCYFGRPAVPVREGVAVPKPYFFFEESPRTIVRRIKDVPNVLRK